MGGAGHPSCMVLYQSFLPDPPGGQKEEGFGHPVIGEREGESMVTMS